MNPVITIDIFVYIYYNGTLSLLLLILLLLLLLRHEATFYVSHHMFPMLTMTSLTHYT